MPLVGTLLVGLIVGVGCVGGVCTGAGWYVFLGAGVGEEVGEGTFLRGAGTGVTDG